jgi:hypothetical protein
MVVYSKPNNTVDVYFFWQAAYKFSPVRGQGVDVIALRGSKGSAHHLNWAIKNVKLKGVGGLYILALMHALIT